MTRPLSPHLRIFRFPPTAVLSILHRVTGVLLTLGLPVWVFWLMQVADGPSAYEPIHAFLQSSAGISSLYLWLFALFMHLCHGLRHLFWDSGRGMLRDSLHRYAMLEFSAAVILTGGCYGLHLKQTELQGLPAADWRGEPAKRWAPSAYGCDNAAETPAPDFGAPVIRCSALVDFINSKPGLDI
ncbi:succinate dehydrogenase, cytochrome b556 subunit [Candidatus Methylospira mobilis]|uniref:Succinate dehydrogenase cytochrome b556 subunit n=1 Tax=Candidatus Methylospira mobilis TaxID=1808979 RepID=A0A5Q0BM20_9GAMM|nr:succinate dehydrogenase, cytochrome b556 subunit [Candidatus Methylospira mobilis]QFY43271.1 succinate dehydrogenase, cytochrome b556 subunit [Candidatus Methylospira mobilis]